MMFRALLALTIFIVALAIIWHLQGWRFVQKPTADQLYGCTLAQELPNGDCP